MCGMSHWPVSVAEQVRFCIYGTYFHRLFVVVLWRALAAVPTCKCPYSSLYATFLLKHLPLLDVYIKPLLSRVCPFSLFITG